MIEIATTIKTVKEENTISDVSKRTPAKPVMCLETRIIYPSAYCAGKQTGIPKNKILQICNGTIRSYRKTHWKFI